MKNLFLASLVLASGAFSRITASASYLDCAPASACPSDVMSETITQGLAIMGDCMDSQNKLSVALGAGMGQQSSLDAAFTTFCSSKCYNGAKGFQSKHDCCLAGLGYHLAFAGLKAACEPSTLSATRYCGAELPMLATLAACATYGTDSATCGAISGCEWAGGMCHFNPTATALDALCTPCTRSYFKQFPGGGFYNETLFSPISALFEYACTRIENTYCLLESKKYGYALPGLQANVNGMNILCSGEGSSITRRCGRALTTIATRGLVRTAHADHAKCTKEATVCNAELAGTIQLSQSINQLAALACRADGGSNCLQTMNARLSSEQCMLKVAGGDCTDCDSSVNDYLSDDVNGGCCPGVWATSSLPIVQRAPAGRLLLANILKAGSSTTKKINSASFSATLTQTNAVAKANLLINAPNICPSVAAATVSEWVTPTGGRCFSGLSTRTVDFGIGASFAAFDACNNKSIVEYAMITDASIAIGISPAQIISSSVRKATATADIVLRIRFQVDSAEDVNDVDAALPNAEFYYLATARDSLLFCPAMLPSNVISPMSMGASVVVADGDVAAPTTTPAPTTSTTTAPTTTTRVTVRAPNSAPTAGAVAAWSVLCFAISALFWL